MFDFSNATEFFTKVSKDAAGYSLVETTNLVETATREVAAAGEMLASAGRVKTADELGNLLISYNVGLLQRSAAFVGKAIERGEAYQTLLRAGIARAAQA